MMWVQRYVVAAGAAAMLGAFISLACPMHLDAADRNGQRLACGSALRPDPAGVLAEDRLNALRHAQDRNLFQLSDYAGECTSRITIKRHVAVGVACAGLAAVVLAQLQRRPQRRRRAARVGESLDAWPQGWGTTSAGGQPAAVPLPTSHGGGLHTSVAPLEPQ